MEGWAGGILRRARLGGEGGEQGDWEYFFATDQGRIKERKKEKRILGFFEELKELKCRGKYTKYLGDGEEEKKRRFYGGGVRGREKSGVFNGGRFHFGGWLPLTIVVISPNERITGQVNNSRRNGECMMFFWYFCWSCSFHLKFTLLSRSILTK